MKPLFHQIFRMTAHGAAIALIVFMAGCSHRSRFFRILDDYDHARYQAKDRDLLFDFNYDSHSESFAPESSGLEKRNDFQETIRNESHN